jgi:UDPglucose--hexose-1-phosphate uridylyltransferase
MPELRKDPIVGRWVIVSEGRADRPNDFEHVPQKRADQFCPFCEGHEDSSPPEIWALRQAGSQPGTPGWRVRVVPNKYPALDGQAIASATGGLFESLPGWGAHELIVESPRHLTSSSELTDEQLAEVLAAYRERMIALRRERRLRYGMIFKNVGPAAGASLEHTHSQLIGLPIVPINVAEEMAGSLAFYERTGKCIYCQLIAEEHERGQRMVLDLGDFVAFCPFAGRFPLETWLLPKSHESHFEQLAQENLLQLAQIMRRVIAGIERVIERPAYNYIIHTSPFDSPALGHYHWHMEIIPRVTNIAGFEWGTGFYINPVPPEEAASQLRQAVAGSGSEGPSTNTLF